MFRNCPLGPELQPDQVWVEYALILFTATLTLEIDETKEKRRKKSTKSKLRKIWLKHCLFTDALFLQGIMYYLTHNFFIRQVSHVSVLGAYACQFFMFS